MKIFATFLALAFAISATRATELFLEAESFHSAGGWTVKSDDEIKGASGLAYLDGSRGAKDGVAMVTVKIQDAGRYRIWVRFSSDPRERGLFHVTALADGRELGDGLFDEKYEGPPGKRGEARKASEVWRSFDADLPDGEVTLRLSKHDERKSSGRTRRIDCLLLTMNEKLVPNHLNYGAQTFLRVTLGEGYERPAYIHVFADHYHTPWYQHFALGRGGAVAGTAPKRGGLLKSGESSAWCNLGPMIYQDSGAMLKMSARYDYKDPAPRLRAKFEIATAPDDAAIVRTLEIDNQPGAISIFFPPNLLTPENRALCKTDAEIAEATGKVADAHPWPTHGKPREKFPFFVTAKVHDELTPADARVEAREQKTLDYFNFMPGAGRHIGGAWLMKNKSYCQPDTEAMQAKFERAAADFKSDGHQVSDIVFCELTDEAPGQPLSFAARDPAYTTHFREWLKAQGLAPADLLVENWDAVRIVTGEERAQFPALYYFSQSFRTRALGDFMALQRRAAEQAYGGTFPVLVNFSDGAIYTGNFFRKGIDYFELLDSPGQNAIWSEDWSNGASTYQCASFNVDLMRGAARDRGQVIGHHLIAYKHRTPWDVKLKATSELARGVKIFLSFCYGPIWAKHDGGPYWRSHAWQAVPEMWTTNAALTREVGAVEDALMTAMPAPAQVALLYSSSSDAWTIDGNLAFGFDRMHTWLALTHAQMPVDIVSEKQTVAGALGRYAVCYLSGPNLTRAAAEKLAAWVQRGGTLWLTAGAASRDEFNRPLHTLDALLPAERGDFVELQTQTGAGRSLAQLAVKDEVSWQSGKASVLSVKQSLTPRAGAETLATFKDRSPAFVRGSAGKGAIYCAGFLPALDYIKQAIDAREMLEKKVESRAALSAGEQREAPLLERTYNPWKYPADLRELLLAPAHAAKIAPPITCDTPLVDAVFMPHERGILIPLANYTAEPIQRLTLKANVPRPIARVESARHGAITFTQLSPQTVELSLPLENNDFINLHFR